jgi:hypothetical protein
MHPCRRFHPEDRLKITDAPSEARIGKDDVVARIRGQKSGGGSGEGDP